MAGANLRPDSICGLVLAAGSGTRFGLPKALAPWRTTTLVAHTVSQLAACSPVLVTTGASAELVEAVLPASVSAVRCTDWQEGMGASLRAGLHAAAETSAAAVVVLLVDTPLVTGAAVERLIGAFDGRHALMADYAGRDGHPVLLPRWSWPGVADSATGDVGARGWIRAHQPQVRMIDCTGLGDPTDADTPTALQALSEGPRG